MFNIILNFLFKLYNFIPTSKNMFNLIYKLILNLFNNQYDKLSSNPCGNLTGEAYNNCMNNINCINNINCNLEGQPANRGMSPSNVDIGTFGDCNVVGNC